MAGDSTVASRYAANLLGEPHLFSGATVCAAPGGREIEADARSAVTVGEAEEFVPSELTNKPAPARGSIALTRKTSDSSQVAARS
jgi:hypothetical protein